jgi:signal transduction histidine kinase
MLWVRAVPLALAVSYLPLAGQPGDPVDRWAWLIGVTASVAFAVGHRFPLTMVGFLSLLLLLSDRVGTQADVVVILATLSALVVLATRRGRWGIGAGGLSVGVGLFVCLIDVPVTLSFFLVVTGVIGCLLAAPILLGLHLRAARQATLDAEQRAIELERRQESEMAMVRATERTAIARELHDIVVHHVASIVLRAGVARHLDPHAAPETAAALDDVHATGTSALADLRRLVAVLRDPSGLDDAHAPLLDGAALPDSLDEVLARSGKAGIRVRSSVDPGVGGLDAVRGLAVLRVVQEGLTNVLKHAGPGAAASVRVVVNEDEAVHVEIHNLGRTAPGPSPRGGHGLIGLRERIVLLGGVFQAGPADGGWQVEASLPGARP